MNYSSVNSARTVSHCVACKKREVKLVRLNENESVTKNNCFVCTNPNCVLYLNISKIKTWKQI